MTIGLDIDDTMTDSSESYIEYAKKHFNSEDTVLINNILHGNNITSEIMNFYDKYLLEILSNVSLKDNVKDVIDRLRTKGHKIILISARGYGLKPEQIDITNTYLQKHDIKVDNIIFKTRDKINACLENSIDLMIDDSVKVLEDLKANGINTLLFNSISNKHMKTSLDCVNNWLGLEMYINNLEDKDMDS
jgi:uncharacterized HAD superfamily protein